MYIKGQKFLILGVSKSGSSAGEFLLKRGAECYICDSNKSTKIRDNIERLISLGAKYVEEENAEDYIEKIDVLVISPGVPINNRLAVKAKQLNKRITGELELGFLQFNPLSVAVTGTNGKTTTVTLIDHILKTAGLESVAVGNNGVPITSEVNNRDSDKVFVTEVSSFQLESATSLCPHVSCVLNIAPDHLERHYGMENYIYLKKRIFKNQRESEYCVLNYDDLTVRSFFEEIKAKVKWVSIKEKVDGAYLDGDKIYYGDEYIADYNCVHLCGEHNAQNVLFSVAVAKILKVENEAIVKVLRSFKGVKDRIEHIARKRGIDYFNDSKATNTASTISAIKCMKIPTVLILGGSEKGEDYTALFEQISNSLVKKVVLTGASRYKMLNQALKVGYSNLTLTEDFNDSVKIASLFACENECVLLSPACASFDKFSSYEERGDAFRKIVEEI